MSAVASEVGAPGLRALSDLLAMSGVAAIPPPASVATPAVAADVDAFVEAMFQEHGRGLVRMVRLFVDDRNAAEDLVQEAFIRLARAAHRIDDDRKAAAYLRSIVLNLARDHNRRGLVSLRHRLPLDDEEASAEDEVILSEEHQQVVDALRTLPRRQRDCLILRYYDELGVDEIADTLGISRNSVKTHLTRGMRALGDEFEGGVVTVDTRLTDALAAGVAAVDESDDLFTRVQLSIAEDRARRSRRRRLVGVLLSITAAIASIVTATIDRREGDMLMDWWILEVIWFAGMVGLALWLGPFIRRFGKAYAADVFRANPRTGKSFIVLMDVAYYLIFFAYIMFAVQFEPAADWESTVNANQLQASTARLGGILLIVGLLHGLNVLTLPVMGRLFTLNRRLDHEPLDTAER